MQAPASALSPSAISRSKPTRLTDSRRLRSEFFSIQTIQSERSGRWREGAAQRKPEFPFDFQNTTIPATHRSQCQVATWVFSDRYREVMKGAEIFHSTWTDFDLTYAMRIVVVPQNLIPHHRSCGDRCPTPRV